MLLGDEIHASDDPVTWLFDEERRIITEVRILIRGGLSEIADSPVPYINKNTQCTAELANLKSRIQYILWMKNRERDKYQIELIETGEYVDYNRDDKYKAMLNDPKFNDLSEFICKLETLNAYIDKLSWILTNTLDKVKP